MAHVFTENEKILKTTILTLKMNILTVTIVKIILRWYSDGNHGKYWWYMFKIDASVMAYINWRTATNSPPPPHLGNAQINTYFLSWGSPYRGQSGRQQARAGVSSWNQKKWQQSCQGGWPFEEKLWWCKGTAAGIICLREGGRREKEECWGRRASKI